jgi:hypothetical protein
MGLRWGSRCLGARDRDPKDKTSTLETCRHNARAKLRPRLSEPEYDVRFTIGVVAHQVS